MHYKNGKPVHLGDVIIGKDGGDNPVAGMVIKQTPGDTCNLVIISTQVILMNAVYATASECLLLDDALALPDIVKPAA